MFKIRRKAMISYLKRKKKASVQNLKCQILIYNFKVCHSFGKELPVDKYKSFEII